MQTAQLLQRNLIYYWRTNLAVITGVAIAVAVLAGALLVGDSVRGSLRDLFLGRLGNTTHVLSAPGFFREQLAAEIENHQQFKSGGFDTTAPLIALEGTITHQESRRLASGIRVYGIDDRFWKFHGRENPAPINQEILISEELARELGSSTGDALLLGVQKPSSIPVESLHSKKDDLGRTFRLTMRERLSADSLGEFSLQPQQGGARSVFVPLKLLQKDLEQEGKANLILVSEDLSVTQSGMPARQIEVLGKILKDSASLEDYGIKLRVLNEQKQLSIESSSGFIPDELADKVSLTARSAETTGALPYLSYLINSIRKDDGREIPYSIVTGVDPELLETMQHDERGHLAGCEASLPAGRGSVAATAELPAIMLNQWAGADLQVKRGDQVTLDYYVWMDEGKLATRSVEFRVACILPMTGRAADRDLVPDYPGITESESFSDWDPPFPIDLKRVRPQDEDYWKKYRTTPKGFISIGVAQELWQSRFGRLTSLRIAPSGGQSLAEAQSRLELGLQETLEPLKAGFAILPVRAQGLEASRGATNFGEYFLYFSFFLVVSALLLTALFFKLGVEQRLREIGVLQAIGFPASRVRNLFLLEGVALSLIGTLAGLAGAWAYGQLMMRGLRTWWVDAVGTTMLKLHVVPSTLLIGAVGGIIAAVICIVWTLRRLRRASTRSLLMGSLKPEVETGRLREPSRRLFKSLNFAVLFSVLGLGLLLASALDLVGQVGGFFGGGTLLLAAGLCYQAAWLNNNRRKTIQGNGWSSVLRLGVRNATHRPGRSVLCVALIASAAFIIVSVDAFRRDSTGTLHDRKSGSGGYPLVAESLVPLVLDPNSKEGREALNLYTSDPGVPLAAMTIERFRLKPGDDASCLNLYQPRNPRILAPRNEFIEGNRFSFAGSLAQTNEEKSNPWRLLNRKFSDGAVPVIVDANSMNYVLHLKLGQDFILDRQSGPVRLRIVGSLADSILQSELIMSEESFLTLFPEQEGYRFFLIDTPAPGELATVLEERLSDFGFDVVSTGERLASFHRVENTYLSTFQMLGGLGLLLGTLGLAAVLLRNVLERRRELALLRAVGYNSSHLTLMVLGENALLLLSGLVTGTASALLAIAPVFLERGGRLPNISLGVLLLAVLVSGLAASIVATWAALRSPLLPALRAE